MKVRPFGYAPTRRDGSERLRGRTPVLIHVDYTMPREATEQFAPIWEDDKEKLERIDRENSFLDMLDRFKSLGLSVRRYFHKIDNLHMAQYRIIPCPNCNEQHLAIQLDPLNERVMFNCRKCGTKWDGVRTAGYEYDEFLKSPWIPQSFFLSHDGKGYEFPEQFVYYPSAQAAIEDAITRTLTEAYELGMFQMKREALLDAASEIIGEYGFTASQSTFKRALRELEAEGWIVRHQENKSGRFQEATYQLATLDQDDDLAPVAEQEALTSSP
ncbi:MAG: hypothetical protein WDZ96_00195 [Acidimicrobiia bacterium]